MHNISIISVGHETLSTRELCLLNAVIYEFKVGLILTNMASELSICLVSDYENICSKWLQDKSYCWIIKLTKDYSSYM